MFWMLPLALAYDLDELKPIGAELDVVDTQIEVAKRWYLADGPAAEGKATQDTLRKAATRAREIHRKLSAMDAHLANGKKRDQDRLPEVRALSARIDAQNLTRASALYLLDAGFAIDALEAGDEPAFAQLNNALYMAVTSRDLQADDDLDAWIRKPLELAVSMEQWKLTYSWGTWCAAVCTDKSLPEAALAKLPERHGKDVRWLALAKKKDGSELEAHR